MSSPNPQEKRPSDDNPPSQEALTKAFSLPVQDPTGHETPFKSLLTPTAPNTRTLVVFIRHFFCGSCEQYITALRAALPPKVLSEASISLVLIGCGAPTLIPSYTARTACPYEIYADPSQRLYKALGMVSNLKVSERPPAYITKSRVSNTLASMWNGVKSGTGALRAGPPSQNGGEWLFGEGGELVWWHRMRTTDDHADVKVLKEVLGL